jgi:hypothetical protein
MSPEKLKRDKMVNPKILEPILSLYEGLNEASEERL